MGYWENRQAQQMYKAMQSAEDAAAEIADIYAKASRELSYQITKVYDRYRDKFDLTDAEAQQLLNTMLSAKDTNDLLNKLQGMKKTSPAAQEIIKQLESPAYRARIERLQNLQNEIDMMMKRVYQQEKKVHTAHYVSQYNNSYYREIYDIKKRTGFDFSFSAVDSKELDRILHMRWSGANYSERIWGNTQGLARELKEQIALAYLTGKAERDIASEIANKYHVGASKARRLVRTESAFVSGQAQAAADEECGIDRYRILATLDLRTSDTCRSMDGKEFDYSKMKTGINFPPFHPYCRTTVISVLDDQNLADLQRRSRDPVTGEPKKFPGNITYKEWYKQEVKNNPKALEIEKNGYPKTISKIEQQYNKYKNIFGKSEVGETLDEFKEMKYNEPEKWNMLKEEKQERINSMSISAVKKLNRMLGTKETREWYKSMDEKIPEIVSKIESLEERAKKAHELRNRNRTQARDLMKDQETRKELDKEHPNLTWEEILEKKEKKYGLTGDEAYEDIVRSSATTNKEYDKKAGLKE